jgi:hypothetical protein
LFSHGLIGDDDARESFVSRSLNARPRNNGTFNVEK